MDQERVTKFDIPGRPLCFRAESAPILPPATIIRSFAWPRIDTDETLKKAQRVQFILHYSVFLPWLNLLRDFEKLIANRVRHLDNH